MVLGHLLYISDATVPFSLDQLESLRADSSSNNQKQEITGVLFYSAGHFVQLLEGDTEKIHTLFEKIASDTRHKNVRLLVLRPAEKRIFTQWNMGLLDMAKFDPKRKRDLDELVRLAGEGDDKMFGTPVEMEILSRFCMMLPAA